MNRKIFALLLLLPVAVMATDKLTHDDHEGGDRQKKKAETTNSNSRTSTTVQANAEADSQNVPIQQIVQQKSEEHSATKQPEPAKQTADFHAKIEELKQTIATMFDPMNEYADYKGHLYLNDESVSDEVKEFIKAKVEEPLEAANPVSIDLERSFSRCPSGYHIVLLSKDEGGLSNQGWMVVDDGCWDRPIAKFRYDIQANTVEGYVGEKTGYLALNAFFKLYKVAAKLEG
jgi:hypothetical protein